MVLSTVVRFVDHGKELNAEAQRRELRISRMAWMAGKREWERAMDVQLRGRIDLTEGGGAGNSGTVSP